ncbi:TonB-dependent receptor [Brevundimonas sp. NIBR11]|uniref:TonB-dependent receptor n=1 Tax=Brevundimonas sp. NIBR11 TaxID=3015999 RepID=UPI0022EFDA5A|nr:TonB-dependent receptor [Brevundimonas sp. NIBR11]WGM30560.1 Vitamin B12 transporter BtuB [Brevundimonas sp. NIBR11]
MTRSIWLTTSAVALLWAGMAQAQDQQPARDSQDEAQLEEVVVTAERRTSNLQTTAVAATVLSGQDLQNRGVTSLNQLQFAAPSTTVQDFGQGNFFNVRGIGKSEATTAIGVGVITYRDGVAAFPAYFQTEPYYDIASLELLRGPQGTFAGANATGGAVFITARNPDFNSINGYAAAQLGNYDQVKVQGAINFPLSDTLAVRLAGNHETRGSFHEITGPYRGNPGEVDSNSVRASVLWTPTPELRVLFKTDYNNINLGGYPADPVLATNDPFKITANGPNEAHDEFVRSSLNISYAFDNGVTLRSITGYQNGVSRFSTDLDGTSVGNNTFYDQLDEEVFSQEFNLISPDQQRLTWLLGLYYQNDMATFPAKTFPTAEYRIGFPENVVDIYLWGDTPKETAAVFGQVSYDLSDRLQVQVGARYAHTTVTNDDVYTTYPQFGIVLFQDQELEDEKLTGKLTLNWKLDDNNFVYGFIATGHKTGGLNAPNLYQPAQTFGSEDLIDYELGWKSTMADGRIRTQVGAYYTVYNDFQVNIGDPQYPQISRVQNVQGDTVLMGLEGSAQAFFGPLSLNVAASVSSSELGDFFGADPRLGRTGVCNPITGPASANCRNISGNRQSYAPEFTFNVGVQYAFDLGGGASLTPRIDYAHIGEAYTSIFNNAALGDLLQERDIVNATVTFAKDDWILSAFSTNLTDQTYIAAVNSGLRYAGPPRQYGVVLTKTF